MSVKPKYELGEIVEIRAMNINMNIKITKRVLKGNYDKKEDIKFYYDFRQILDIEKPWTWSNVDESTLEELIWGAKNS